MFCKAIVIDMLNKNAKRRQHRLIAFCTFLRLSGSKKPLDQIYNYISETFDDMKPYIVYTLSSNCSKCFIQRNRCRVAVGVSSVYFNDGESKTWELLVEPFVNTKTKNTWVPKEHSRFYEELTFSQKQKPGAWIELPLSEHRDLIEYYCDLLDDRWVMVGSPFQKSYGLCSTCL